VTSNLIYGKVPPRCAPMWPPTSRALRRSTVSCPPCRGAGGRGPGEQGLRAQQGGPDVSSAIADDSIRLLREIEKSFPCCHVLTAITPCPGSLQAAFEFKFISGRFCLTSDALLRCLVCGSGGQPSG
jgi:hypothetical protein